MRCGEQRLADRKPRTRESLEVITDVYALSRCHAAAAHYEKVNFYGCPFVFFDEISHRLRSLII